MVFAIHIAVLYNPLYTQKTTRVFFIAQMRSDDQMKSDQSQGDLKMKLDQPCDFEGGSLAPQYPQLVGKYIVPDDHDRFPNIIG